MQDASSESTPSPGGGLQSEGRHANGKTLSNSAHGVGESSSLSSKPLLDGYHMPAEWEAHERNPTLTKQEVENNLRDYLGVETVLWLGRGVVGDIDTNGHVDNFLAFVRPGEVVLHWTDDVDDEQHAISVDALNRLEKFTDARGRRLKVHKCSLPGPMYTSKENVASLEHAPGSQKRASGDRLAASYINFYLANGAVILPGFGVPEDEAALELFNALFPEREVVQVMTRDIILGGGNIHCITAQQPLGATGVPAYVRPTGLAGGEVAARCRAGAVLPRLDKTS